MTWRLHFSQPNWRRISDHEVVITRSSEGKMAAVFLAALLAPFACVPLWLVFTLPFSLGDYNLLSDMVFVLVLDFLLWWAILALLKVALPYDLCLNFADRTYQIREGMSPRRRVINGSFADIDHLFIRWQSAPAYGGRSYVMMLKWAISRPPHSLGMSYSENQAEADMRALADALGTMYVGKITLQPPQC